jgi:hypothetical protein
MVLTARAEAEPPVVRRRAFEEHEWDFSASQSLQAVADQRSANTVALAFRKHTDGTEHLNVDEPLGSVEEVAGEQDVNDERGDNRTVIAERKFVYMRDGGMVLGVFLAYEHGRTVCAAQMTVEPFVAEEVPILGAGPRATGSVRGRSEERSPMRSRQPPRRSGEPFGPILPLEVRRPEARVSATPRSVARRAAATGSQGHCTAAESGGDMNRR